MRRQRIPRRTRIICMHLYSVFQKTQRHILKITQIHGNNTRINVVKNHVGCPMYESNKRLHAVSRCFTDANFTPHVYLILHTVFYICDQLITSNMFEELYSAHTLRNTLVCTRMCMYVVRAGNTQVCSHMWMYVVRAVNAQVCTRAVSVFDKLCFNVALTTFLCYILHFLFVFTFFPFFLILFLTFSRFFFCLPA